MAQSTKGERRTGHSSTRSFSAWLPVLMSGAATAILVTHLATGPHEPYMVVENGVSRPDESPTARLWQLLLLLQLPLIGWHGIRWLQSDPKGTVTMLAIQALAIIAAAMPVFVLDM